MRYEFASVEALPQKVQYRGVGLIFTGGCQVLKNATGRLAIYQDDRLYFYRQPRAAAARGSPPIYPNRRDALPYCMVLNIVEHCAAHPEHCGVLTRII